MSGRGKTDLVGLEEGWKGMERLERGVGVGMGGWRGYEGGRCGGEEVGKGWFRVGTGRLKEGGVKRDGSGVEKGVKKRVGGE